MIKIKINIILYRRTCWFLGRTYLNTSLANLCPLLKPTVYNMKHSIGRVDTDPEVKNFPFMLQILCNDIRPFFGALMMDKVWRYTTAKQFLAIYIGQLKLLAETQLKRRIRNVVFTVPVSFS